MANPTDLERAGREAGADELALKLGAAGAAYLLGAVENESLTEELVVKIVASSAANESVIQTIGNNPEWLKSYRVKREITRHQRAPHALALSLVKFMFWKDLHLLSENHFIFPPIRRMAERLLIERLPRMALGEKMTLGRIAGRALIPKLLDQKVVMVIDAALWNGRLTAQDLLQAINSQKAGPEVLGAMGRHPKWCVRAEIRAALANNPKTPISVTLSFLTSMPERDLQTLAANPRIPTALKAATARVLARATLKGGKPIKR
jgi:hypothetical protein